MSDPKLSRASVDPPPTDDDLLDKEMHLDPEKALDEAQTAASEVDFYKRFSPRRKALISALVSFAAFLAPVSSSSFFPSIPSIASDLSTTQEMVNYTCVAVYLVVLGVAPLFWSALAGFYGRRPIYLSCIPIFTLASLGCALSNSLGALIACRVLQAFGSSSVLAVGAGTIGDLFHPLERATQMGIFYMGILLGPAIMPLIAGILQEYTPIGWKATQYLMAALGGLAMVLLALFLPETWHGPTPHEQAKRKAGKKFIVFKFNPFRAVALLQQANILLVSLNSSFVLLTTYILIVPLTYTLAPRYGISNVAIIGLLYLPQGAGNIVAARLGGMYADRTVKRWIEKRGYRRPEDRLYSTLIGGGVIIPGSLIAVGWIIESGKGGLAPALIMYFLSGVGLMMVLSSSNTYLVDCLQTRSAEVIAINNCIRYLFAAGASAGILPLVKAIGVGPANTLAAGIAWMGFGTVLLTLKWGEKWSGRPVPTISSNPPSAGSSETPTAVLPPSRASSAETLPTPPLARKTRDGGELTSQEREKEVEVPGVTEILARTTSVH